MRFSRFDTASRTSRTSREFPAQAPHIRGRFHRTKGSLASVLPSPTRRVAPDLSDEVRPAAAGPASVAPDSCRALKSPSPQCVRLRSRKIHRSATIANDSSFERSLSTLQSLQPAWADENLLLQEIQEPDKFPVFFVAPPVAEAGGTLYVICQSRILRTSGATACLGDKRWLGHGVLANELHQLESRNPLRVSSSRICRTRTPGMPCTDQCRSVRSSGRPVSCRSFASGSSGSSLPYRVHLKANTEAKVAASPVPSDTELVFPFDRSEAEVWIRDEGKSTVSSGNGSASRRTGRPYPPTGVCLCPSSPRKQTGTSRHL